MSTRRTVLLVPILLAFTGACATSPIQKEAAETLISPQDEVDLGKQVRAEVLKNEKVSDNQDVQKYVQGVGNKIVELNKDRLPKEFKPTFTVLENDQINAFAIPGGDIFVYTGLLRAVENEAELASVLSHEMGHVVERHAAQGMVAQLGLGTIAELIVGKNPSTLAQIGTSIAANGFLVRNTQSMERQADQVGMKTMIASGWDPHQMIAFFNKLAAQQGHAPSALEAFLSSHPPPADRAQYLTKELDDAGNPGGKTNPDAIAHIKSELPPAKTASQPGNPRG
jgi:predicted Zn-dependent protease